MAVMDRDLLWWEPALFREVAWAGQILTRGKATITGDILLMADASVDFVTAAVQAGQVIVVGDVPLEIVQVRGEEDLRVSLVRARGEETVRPPGDAASADAWVMSFVPQVALAAASVSRLIGVDVSRVVNGGEADDLVALTALELIARAAGAAGGVEHPWTRRAEWFAERAKQEAARVVIEVDADGDGVVDQRRRAREGELRRG